jgi:hypothetical protein
MYIAEMYAYGTDNDCVGVNGIVTCMAIFVLRNYWLQAIHVPNDSQKEAGRDALLSYFTQKNMGNTDGAMLYAVVNGTSRAGAEDEVRGYQSRLNPTKTTFVRFMPKVQGGVAFICQRVLGVNKAVLKYKTTEHGEWWVKNLGNARGGYYRMDNGDNKYGVASTEDFIPIAKSNAEIKTLNAGSLACSIM